MPLRRWSIVQRSDGSGSKMTSLLHCHEQWWRSSSLTEPGVEVEVRLQTNWPPKTSVQQICEDAPRRISWGAHDDWWCEDDLCQYWSLQVSYRPTILLLTNNIIWNSVSSKSPSTKMCILLLLQLLNAFSFIYFQRETWYSPLLSCRLN